MKSHKLLLATLLATPALSAMATIQVQMPQYPGASIVVEQKVLDESQVSPEPQTLILDAKGNATMQQAEIPVIISITYDGKPVVTNIFSTSGTDALSVSVSEEGTATVSGTQLAEGVNNIDKMLAPYFEQYSQIQALYQIDPQAATKQAEELDKASDDALLQYAADHKGAPELAYLLKFLSGENFMKVYDTLSLTDIPAPLAPAVEKMRNKTQQRLEAEKKMAALESGTTPAPGFTLPDLDGNMLSLTDFKGKWVILDFWGSWCRWCIKGFPELKELQAKYGDKLAIVGVDCRDSVQKWKDAVAKYEMTWTNLYNDCSSETPNALLDAYAVQGFPTKVIVDPQGVIKKIVVGADPEFPNILASFMGE